MKKLMVFLTIFAFVLMSGTAMATVTASNLIGEVWGGKRIAMFNIAFDSSYPTGGESVTLNDPNIRFSSDQHVMIMPKNGYNFEWDYANNKIKAFSSAPAIIYEEKHGATEYSTSGWPVTGFQLDYPAAWIINLTTADAGGSNFQLIYSGTTTLGIREAALSAQIQDGVRTGITVSLDAGSNPSGASDFLVTYITQAWTDVYELLVQNQAIVIDTSIGQEGFTGGGNTIFAWGWGKFASSAVTPIEYGGTPGDNDIAVDFGNSGTSGSILDGHADNDDEQLLLTYLRYPAILGAPTTGITPWLLDRFVMNEDPTAGTSVMNLDRPLLMWNITGHTFVSGNTPCKIVSEDVLPHTTIGAPGTGVVGGQLGGVTTIQPGWGYRGVAADAAIPDDHQVWAVYDNAQSIMTDATYVFGHPWEIQNLVPLEVRNGTDLSGLNNVKVLMIGR